MKMGIVGCGLNSDYHINFAKQYSDIHVAGVIDNNLENARKCAERHTISNTFSSISEMVEKVGVPDVLHIVTPPHTHYPLAAEALSAGCNVLLEKPMTLSIVDAESLFEQAEEQNLKLCTMHNHFFDPCMLKARELIASGALGQIVHVESYYGMNTQIDAFRKYPRPNVLPWLYSLPGGVFHDFMAHPLYVMLPYTGRPKSIKVMERSLGSLPQNISDEVRVLVDGEEAFGNLTFSFSAKPLQHYVTIYGTKMVVKVNFDTMSTITHGVSCLPKAAQKATFNLSEAYQLSFNTVRNVWNFGTRRLRPYQGMKELIHRYYDSIRDRTTTPVSKIDALNVIRTMDDIWPEIKNKALNFSAIMPEEQTELAEEKPKILVTGATGFLGLRLVELFVENGYPVRAIVRKLSRIDSLKKLPVEIFFADVAETDSLDVAFDGVDMVVHAAADTEGSREGGQISTIQGTINILHMAEEHKIKKLIYISSCSVYGVADYNEGAFVSEEYPLEQKPEARGAYSNAKFQAERLVTEAMKKETLNIVCLRPGTIYGPGGDIYTPMMGLSMGTKMFLTIKNNGFVLPLVFIDNVVSAILESIEKEESNGQIFNLLDNDHLTKEQYLDQVVKKVYPTAFFLNIPYGLFSLIVRLQEILFKLLKRKPVLTMYRLISSQKRIFYSIQKIQKEMLWNPPVTNNEAMHKLIMHERRRLR